MTTLRGALAAFWDRHAGGLLPVAYPERAVTMADGTQYNLSITLFRRALRFGYDTPHLPRSVRRARAAEDTRLAEHFRRVDAGEPLVQVGDRIRQYATGKLATCLEVRASDLTIWKRAAGDERYLVDDDDGIVHRDVAYDWVGFVAGKWGHAWCTDEVLLTLAPLTVLKVAEPAGPPLADSRDSA